MELSSLILNNNFLYRGEKPIAKLPTGFITLDIALGGGIPYDGNIIHCFGLESNGKSSFATLLCKATVNHNGYVTWIDSENSADPEWMSIQGLDPSQVIIYRPTYKEECMSTIIEDIKCYRRNYLPWLEDPNWKPSPEIAEMSGFGVSKVSEIKGWMTDNAPYHTLVWDSISASPMKAQLEDDPFKNGMMAEARLHKQFLRILFSYMAELSHCNIIILNQAVDDIDAYRPDITYNGGHALSHAMALNFKIKKHGKGTQSDIGSTINDYTTITIMKNKVSPVSGIVLPINFDKSKGFLPISSVYEYLNSINFFKGTSWKKFTYAPVNEETMELDKDCMEEISFQPKTLPKKLHDNPNYLLYLALKVRDCFTEQFPNTASLKSNLTTITRYALEHFEE